MTPAASSPATGPADQTRTAWADGLVTTSEEGVVLDAWYPAPRLGEPPAERRAAVGGP